MSPDDSISKKTFETVVDVSSVNIGSIGDNDMYNPGINQRV